MSPLWAGRFTSSPAEALWDFTVDLATDAQLWPYDIAVNKAHARMLHRQGILSADDHVAIQDGLDMIEAEFADDRFEWHPTDEDIHMAIERRLSDLAGEAGRRIHAARSRNDQVSTDFRLWCGDAASRLVNALDGLAAALCEKADDHAADLAPGFTHLQRAQPVTIGHMLMAHVEAFDRDASRFLDARCRNDMCALGAGALACTTLPIDPEQTAAELGFDRPFTNSIDAVAARDFAAELLAAASICAMHLSRLAEEVVLWSTVEFAAIRLDDAWATGSSMMPQKKNPDIAELSRAVPGRVTGAFVSLVTIVKGLALAYNRDLQEDKAATFAAIRRLELALLAMTGLISTAGFDTDRLARAAAGGGAAATDLAEVLVANDVAFRDAHEIVGALVGRLSADGRDLETITADELAAAHPALEMCAGAWLDARACVERRTVDGGPHPESVRRAVNRARDRIAARTPAPGQDAG